MKHKHHVVLSAAQRKKLLQGGTVRIKHAHIAKGDVPLFITKSQMAKLARAYALGKSAQFQFESQSQADHHVKHGGGFWSSLARKAAAVGEKVLGGVHKKIVQKMGEMPRMIQQFLDKHGSQNIAHIQLGRKPVQAGVQLALNLISQGELEKTRNELDYDHIWHSYLLVKLQNGPEIRLEKNERVVISESISAEDRKQVYTIPVSRPLTLKELIQNAAQQEGENLWRYSPADTNCQRFAYDLIRHSRLMPTDPNTLEALTPQNGEKLIASLGNKAGYAKFVTDLGGYFNVIRNGGDIQ